MQTEIPIQLMNQKENEKFNHQQIFLFSPTNKFNPQITVFVCLLRLKQNASTK